MATDKRLEFQSNKLRSNSKRKENLPALHINLFAGYFFMLLLSSADLFKIKFKKLF